jgi:hypothetical protein
LPWRSADGSGSLTTTLRTPPIANAAPAPTIYMYGQLRL